MLESMKKDNRQGQRKKQPIQKHVNTAPLPWHRILTMQRGTENTIWDEIDEYDIREKDPNDLLSNFNFDDEIQDNDPNQIDYPLKKYIEFSILKIHLPPNRTLLQKIQNLDTTLAMSDILGLIQCLPSEEEARKMKASRAIDVTSVIALQMCSEEYLIDKLTVWYKIRSISEDIEDATTIMTTIADCLNTLQNSTELMQFLRVTLNFGNILNANNDYRGRADAFSLEGLLLLKDVPGLLQNGLKYVLGHVDPLVLLEQISICRDAVSTTTDANILLKNLQLTIYSNEINYQPLGILVEDENVAWYGMDITDIEIPFGRNSETKYLNIEGTDTNVAYRQNIRGKEIKIHFSLDGCDLNETTAQVQQLAKLFTNKRDELNAPIPKEIRFTHIPDKFFYYILEDTFDTDINISDYKGSITLFIPDGTAFDIKDTVTNVNGYVEGIASVNPIIALTHITNNQLTVSELVNNPNQVFKINKDNLSDTNITFGVNDTIVINCITRECVLIKSDETETIDITEAVDFNSDWFKIQGEFEFKSENCVIQTVTYNTRS